MYPWTWGLLILGFAWSQQIPFIPLGAEITAMCKTIHCACNMSAGIQTQVLTIVQQGVFTIEPSIQPLSSRILSEGRPG